MAHDRSALARAALAGGFTALALVATVLAAMGVVGQGLLAQSLLANLKVHMATGAAALWLCTAVAGWRWIGLGGALATGGYAAMVLTGVSWAPLAPADTAGRRIDIIHLNVWFENPNPGEVARAFAASSADVVTVLEAEPLLPELEALAVHFPYRFGCMAGRCDTLVLSRRPIAAATWFGPPHAPQRFAQVRLDMGEGQSFTVFAVHWARDFFSGLRSVEGRTTVQQILAHERAGGGPYVVTGDFNATPWDPTLRRITRRLGLRPLARWTPTWPVGFGALGLQIDHVFVPRSVTATAFGRLPDRLGSNHHGLSASLLLPD